MLPFCNLRSKLLSAAVIAMALGVIPPHATPPAAPAFAPVPPLAAVRASEHRIIDVTVCLRPFRAEGPRLDVEPLGSKTVVHNYGHGGSGWSLSWGSSTMAVQRAMASGNAVPFRTSGERARNIYILAKIQSV